MYKSKQVLQKKWLINNQGFSLVEVIAGIVIITAFSLVALQAMTYSMYQQVKAERKSRATNWIQSRVEKVKLRASQLDTNDKGTVKPKKKLCSASSKDKGYADKLKENLAEGKKDDNDGDKVNTKEVFQTKETLGKDIFLVRKANPKGKEPYNVLKLQYEAKLENSNKVIADFYTEVVPKASLVCF